MCQEHQENAPTSGAMILSIMTCSIEKLLEKMYLAYKLFPKGSNGARELAQQFSNPGSELWLEVMKYVGYLKKHKKGIKMTYQKQKELRVVSNADSNYATNNEDRRSISGHLHTVGGTLVSWMSKTQESVALSSCESEYVSLPSGSQEAKFIQMLLTEVMHCVTPRIMLEDNTGAIFLLKNVSVGAHTKHNDIRWHYIYGLRANGDLEVDFVCSEDNEADICMENLRLKLLGPFSESIQNGRINVRTRYKDIIVAVDRASVHFTQKEGVMNWVHGWMNHGTMIPKLSGLIMESISRPIQVYYVELNDWTGSAEPG
jgi:hypothetical protein